MFELSIYLLVGQVLDIGVQWNLHKFKRGPKITRWARIIIMFFWPSVLLFGVISTILGKRND